MKILQISWCIIVLIILHISSTISAQTSYSNTNFSSKSINYCQLFNSTTYDEKVVITTAVLYSSPDGEPRVDGGSDDFFYLSKCNNRDYFAKADFSNAENLHLIRQKWEQTLDKNYPTLYWVTFSGKISLSFIPTFGHLNRFRAQFKIDKIVSVKIIKSKYPLPDSESDAPNFEAGNALKYINSELIFSFFGRGFNTIELESLLTNDAKIIINEKLVSIKDLSEQSWNKIEGSLAVQVSEVTRNKYRWRIQGVIINTLKDKSVTKIKYDNKYVQKDSSWKLVFSRISFIKN